MWPPVENTAFIPSTVDFFKIHFSRVFLGCVQIIPPQSNFSSQYHCRLAHCPPVTRMNIDKRPTQRTPRFGRRRQTAPDVGYVKINICEYGSKWEQDPRDSSRFSSDERRVSSAGCWNVNSMDNRANVTCTNTFRLISVYFRLCRRRHLDWIKADSRRTEVSATEINLKLKLVC